MARGKLRVYLGAAPGVGKTYAMLDEGWRRHERGTDVVIGFVETHRRPKTAAQIRDLEVVPRRTIEYRGTTFEEMDLKAVLARKPQVALVDEMAHTNVPASGHEKRWQDIEELLDAGIDVISTVNVQHLESLNDVVERITGVVQRETVPDAVVRRADQIELVDMSPEALRRRMAHGNIYPAERVDAALGNYFRQGNLAALRELALLWVADQVEDSLQAYMDAHGISESWETRERVVVAITGVAGGDDLVRRAARMAARQRRDLVGVHVVPADGLTARAGPDLEDQRRLLEEMGGSYREVVGEDVSVALAEFARAEKATQLVLGASRRSRLHELVRGSVVNKVLRHARGIDVHVISTTDEAAEPPTGRPARRRSRSTWLRRSSPLPARRRVAGIVIAVVGLPLLTVILESAKSSLSLPTDLLLFLGLVVVVAAVGGVLVGAVTAVAASLLVNWYLVPPTGSFTIGEPENLAALGVFVAIAVVLGFYVDRTAARFAGEAQRARTEAEVLARTTATLVGERDPVVHLVEQIRAAFSLDAVALLGRHGDTWSVVAGSGASVPATPFDDATWEMTVDAETVLVVRGPRLAVADERVLQTFVSQLGLALESRRLHAQAARAVTLADTNALRIALLQAVSHDLRTPLASIKASVTSLLQDDVEWTDRDRHDFLATIDAETDRLDHVVGNLLDMSRLQSGGVEVASRAVFLEDVVANALASLSCGQDSRIEVSVPESLPAVECDPALLERVLANVVSNAVAWSAPEAPVRIEAARVVDLVHLRVIDKGPGIRVDDRERVFEPFQRLGDRSNEAGVGLGLAVARGFIHAMGGRIELEDTPGGGLTVVIELAVMAP